MKSIAVLQFTDAEHLGFVEDHLEGRNIGFRYIRPAHDPNWKQKLQLPKDGLIVLGAAPYGTVSPPIVPLLSQHIQIVHTCLEENLAVIGFSTGSQILALAAGSTTVESKLNLTVETAYRQKEDALNGYLPQSYPCVQYMSDFPEVPKEAKVLATTTSGRPALYQLGKNCFGFLGHPGIKRGIIEDSFLQMPSYALDQPESLQQVSNYQADTQRSLIGIMTGLIQKTGWMQD